MREENANAVETGRDGWTDGWRRAGWMVGLREKERRGSGDGVTFWQGQSFSLDDGDGAGFALMDLLSMGMSCISAWAHHAPVINQIMASV